MYEVTHISPAMPVRQLTGYIQTAPFGYEELDESDPYEDYKGEAIKELNSR